jgi:hypothetical protein
MRFPLRPIGAVLANLAFAALGPVIAEGSLEYFFDRHTLYGAPRNYAVATAAVAFIHGCAVYWKWKSASAQWIGLAGLIGLACRLFFGPVGPSFPSYPNWLVFEFVSLRLIGYSSGALLCAGLLRQSATARVRSRSR